MPVGHHRLLGISGYAGLLNRPTGIFLERVRASATLGGAAAERHHRHAER